MTGMYPYQQQRKANPIENALSFINIASNSVRRNNPILAMINSIQYTLYIMLTFHQKLNLLKHRVNQMHYRLYQMEQTINSNNPYNFKKGTTMNQIR